MRSTVSHLCIHSISRFDDRSSGELTYERFAGSASIGDSKLSRLSISPMSTSLTHIDESGHAHMVDVSDKAVSHRVAVATGRVYMQPETLALIRDGGHDKGDVLAVARIAGIQASKKCADLIPLCHPLALTSVAVEVQLNEQEDAIDIAATCRIDGKTGVEMEALTAVSVAALTIYDMCKAVDRGMEIGQVRLQKKSGGRSGEWVRP